MKRHLKSALLLLSMIMILVSCSEPSLDGDRKPQLDPPIAEDGGSPDTDGTESTPPVDETPLMNPILKELGFKLNSDGSVTMPTGVVLTDDGFIAGTVDQDGNLRNPDGKAIEKSRGTDEDYILIDAVQASTSWEMDEELSSHGTKTDDRKGRITFTLDKPYVNGDMTVHYMHEVDYHHIEPESTDRDIFVVFTIKDSGNKQSFHMKERKEGNLVLLDGMVIEYPASI